MERDGQCISLWQHGMETYKPVNQLLSAQKIDVVIVGGGITGLTTALMLQKAGKKCMVAEARNIGFGTTGGTTSHLNTFMDTPYYKMINDFGEKNAQQVVRLALNSIELIERNINEYGIDCGFEKKEAYLFSQNDEQSDELEKIIESCRKLQLDMEYTTSLAVPIPFEKSAKVGGQAQMHATRYLYGIAAAFEKAGGRILQNCRVTNLITEEGKTYVETPNGKIETAYVIYATHIPPGVNILHFRCAPYRSYAMAVKLKDGNYPDALVYDLYDPYRYYRTQDIDGEKFLIAGGEDHKTAHEENTEACFERLEAYVRSYFDVAEVPFRWSSQYFEPADGLPYIGHLPGNPDNVMVATGFGGNGIIYGTGSAIILADIICNGKSEYEELFKPARVKPVAGFENFMKEAADVVGVFIGQAFSAEKIEGLTEIKEGEAKVVKYEGSSIAVYKDNTGRLFGVNPSCPHIKCSVAWNGAEKSWDCPCHGSRFSFTGQLLTGPSRKDLEVVDLGNKP